MKFHTFVRNAKFQFASRFRIARGLGVVPALAISASVHAVAVALFFVLCFSDVRQ